MAETQPRTQVTALLRALQDKGYVEINPLTESVTQGKILYVENIGLTPITVNVGNVANGGIAAETSSADYNHNAVPVNNSITNLVLAGANNAPQYVDSVNSLQRILKVELIGADNTVLDYRDEQFYNGVTWVDQQRQVPTIFRDHSLKSGENYTLRVHLPRIPTGTRISGQITSELFKWDALTPTVTTPVNIDILLTADNLLKGYVDIEVSDFAASMDNPSNTNGTLDKKNSFNATYEGNYVTHRASLMLSVVTSGSPIVSDLFVYDCIVKLPRPITYIMQKGTTANVVTLTARAFQLEGTVRADTPICEVLGIAKGFIGTHTYGGVGINRGKRYIEARVERWSQNFIGLFQPVMQGDGSYRYVPMYGFRGYNKLIIDGEETTYGDIFYVDGSVLKLAVDFNTGIVKFGVDNKWLDLDNPIGTGATHENFASADYAQLQPSPDFLGMPPLTYGILYTFDNVQDAYFRFIPVKTQYTPPMDYQPFL